MPNYISVKIGQMEVQVEKPEDLPVSIDYALEDSEDFTEKKSSNALSLVVPATLLNEKVANTFRNPDVADMTSGEVFRSNQPCIIESNGMELLVGKAFLTSATHTDKPVKYKFDLYGDNADWLIDLREATLYDFVKQITINFTRDTIVASWNYNGLDESKPYVFAPIRYRKPWNDARENYVQVDAKIIKDIDYPIEQMKPSISVYWIIYWGFKSIGYRVESKFFNLPYFRKAVMPWAWGNFLQGEGTNLEVHRFLAKSTEKSFTMSKYDDYIDTKASNDSSNGGFDNNNDYTYDPVTKEMKWTYKTNYNFGPMVAAFSITIDVDASASWNSDTEMKVRWFKNNTSGAPLKEETLVSLNAPALGSATDKSIKTSFFNTDNSVVVNPGDSIICKLYVHIFESKTGNGAIYAEVLEFKVEYFKIPIGGTVDFANLTGFKKYKFLDFFKGIVGAFNLSFNTDATSKVLYIEPTHAYSTIDDLTLTNEGYFKNDFIDWNGKEDLTKEWEMVNFREYEREVSFKFKDDANDGILKVVQDRNVNKLAVGKYVFPERFKQGKKEVENAFFSPLMHYDVEQWKTITGIAPQIPVMVPENISNTSQSEADNTFQPKLAFYKGNLTGVGGWRFDGEILSTFPFMFAVNYKVGGQNDPIFSYSDEKISDGSGGFVAGKGLLLRFFMQRMAIMRNGQWYSTWFRLQNRDVANQLHREYKSYSGHRWELIDIKDYRPLQQVPTACTLRRWAPVEQTDLDNTFPSSGSVLNGAMPNKLDVKYNQLKCLATDVPTE
jgi:hypothetical protein